MPDTAAMSGPLEMEATDTGLHWSLEEDADGSARRRRLDDGDGASATVVRAPASDLLLSLYRRRPVAALDVTGEAGVAERFVLRNSTD
jgi:hypothetical protein